MNYTTALDDINARVPAHETETRADGLKYCVKCGQPVEVRIKNERAGIDRTFICVCDCDRRRADELAEREKAEQIEHNRRICFQNSGRGRLIDSRFEDALDYNEKQLHMAMRYAEMIDQALHGGEELSKGSGLIFFGPLGTGKSFLAVCIANAVISKGVTALWTNIADIETRTREDFRMKPVIMEELMKTGLLIIDDLGAERQSDFLTQLTFQVIDARVRSSRPIIVTTNMKKGELLDVADVSRARIYDRLLECCVPIEVSGKSIRRKEFAERYEKERKALEGL